MFTSIKSSITNTGGQYASTSVSYILNIPQEKEEKRDKQTEKKEYCTNPFAVPTSISFIFHNLVFLNRLGYLLDPLFFLHINHCIILKIKIYGLQVQVLLL
jgi:hypothetical protein